MCSAYEREAIPRIAQNDEDQTQTHTYSVRILYQQLSRATKTKCVSATWPIRKRVYSEN